MRSRLLCTYRDIDVDDDNEEEEEEEAVVGVFYWNSGQWWTMDMVLYVFASFRRNWSAVRFFRNKKRSARERKVNA